MKRIIHLSWLIFGLIGSRVHAQNYSLDWFTIDGGGGTSAGGSYSLNGTIGQYDAATMSGGAYVLNGGFWSAIEAIQVSGQPTLHARIENSGLVLYWPAEYGGFSVQRADALVASPWRSLPDVPQQNGSVYEVRLQLQPGMQFYRLKH